MPAVDVSLSCSVYPASSMSMDTPGLRDGRCNSAPSMLKAGVMVSSLTSLPTFTTCLDVVSLTSPALAVIPVTRPSSPSSQTVLSPVYSFSFELVSLAVSAARVGWVVKLLPEMSRNSRLEAKGSNSESVSAVSPLQDRPSCLRPVRPSKMSVGSVVMLLSVRLRSSRSLSKGSKMSACSVVRPLSARERVSIAPRPSKMSEGSEVRPLLSSM